MWYNKEKKEREIDMCKEFHQPNYRIADAIHDAKTKPEVALWFTNQIKDSDLARIFVREWLYKMEKKEGLDDERL